MSGDEVFVTILSAAVAAVGWGHWYWRSWRLHPWGVTRAGVGVLRTAPLVGVALVVAVLRMWAASDVRDAPQYLVMYALLGAAWLALAARMTTLAGVSSRDDVIERGNYSAAMVIGGALVGTAMAYSGGNVGDGPGWWVVVFSSGLATLTLFGLWLVLDRVSRVSDVVTIDRDPAAGLRLGGFLVACGAICGRAAAGDWVSAAATVRDFIAVAQPVLAIVVLALVAEHLARPTPSRPQPSLALYGAVPAAIYVAIAAIHLFLLGPA